MAEHAVLRGLFGDPRFAALQQDELGFTAEGAIRCTDALPVMLPRELREHLHVAGAPAERFDERHPAFAWASSQLGGWQDRSGDEQARFMPLVWALSHTGDALLVTADALAETAGVDTGAAAELLHALEQTWGHQTAVSHSADGVDEFLEVDDAVLEEVAGASGSLVDQLYRVVRLDVLRQDERADVRLGRGDL